MARVLACARFLICVVMSLLAQRSLATLMSTGVVQFSDGQAGIGRDAVVACLTNLLRERGLSNKQIHDRLVRAFQQAPRLNVLRGVARDNFVSLRGLQHVCRLLELPLPPATIEITDADAAVAPDRSGRAEQAMVAVAPHRPGRAEQVMQISDDEEDDVPGPVDPEQRVAEECLPEPEAGMIVPVPGGVFSARQLMGLDHSVVVRLCVKQQRQLQARSAKIKMLSNQLAQAKRRASKQDKVQAKQKALEAQDSNSAFAIRKLGRQLDGRSGRLSIQSMFSIGLRRSLTHVAAGDFGLLAMTDISAQTVTRREHRAAAALIYSFQIYVAEGLKMMQVQPGMVACDDEPGFHLFAVGYRCDATNSSIWRRKKLQVLEAAVSYISNDAELRAGNFSKAMTYRRCVLLG